MEISLIAGVDEVGRGCLFGPVVASAVVFSPNQADQLQLLGVKDSKQLSLKKRLYLAEQIQAIAQSIGIGCASVKEIDRLNILQASLLAMKRAINQLCIPPDYCLIDGKFLIPSLTIPQQAIVQGDQRSPFIASASIIAKVYRDNLIMKMAKKYPDYDLENNKGYPTKKHKIAIQNYGLTPHHRLSFAPCLNRQYTL